jgi:LuxR family maltose regulon positive regulatory protein
MPRAAQLLEEVERRGLFVSLLEADELTLRLHDLFRDFLEDRLQREHPEELPGLLRRAADNEPDLARAVNHLARAGAWEEAAQALVQRAPALLAAGGGPALEQLLALFPPDEFEARPDLHMLRGLASFPRFDFEGMVLTMRRAAEGFERAGRGSEAALARTYACLGLQNTNRMAEALAELDSLYAAPLAPPARALVCFACAWGCYATTRTEHAAAYVADMLDALERQPLLEVWDRCFFQSLLTGLPGMRPLLERFAAGALRVSGDAPTQLRAGAWHIRTWLALAAGRLAEAADCLAHADEDCRWLGMPRSVMTENWMAHTLVDALLGRREASLAAAQANKRDLIENALPGNRLTHEYEELFTYVRACWILEEDGTLHDLVAEMALAVNPYEWAAAPLNRSFGLALAACADGRLDEAQRLLEPLAADSVERSCYFTTTQARVVLAWVLLRQGHADAAAAALAPWFESLRAGSGDVGGALLAGPRVLNTLAAADWGSRLDVVDTERLRELAARLQQAHGSAPLPRRGGTQAVVLPPQQPAAQLLPAGGLQQLLSEREREVLERMAAGDSNKLIARAFDLSPHTVKRHVANILGKLGVETRGQAAARWRSERASRAN